MKTLLVSIALLSSTNTFAAEAPRGPDNGAFLLTIFFKHDQSKNLGEIQAQLKKSGFEDKFPRLQTRLGCSAESSRNQIRQDGLRHPRFV